ncbi:MAG: molybdenum cofactor biosynthesis protein [Anaerolineales bacterium]
MKINLLYFATYKQRIGKAQEEIEIHEAIKVKDLKKLLIEKYPAVGFHQESTLISVNKEFAFDDDFIPEGAQVAIFPPVSGGEMIEGKPTIIKLTQDKLEIEDILEELVLPTTGAACLFLGFVRQITQLETMRHTSHLEYEAYPEMASEKMLQIATEIRKKWPLIEGIAIIQRIGVLPAKTPTVAIICTAAHRDDGIFEAARFGIDRLKQIVPIWKKEVGANGEYWVEGHYIPKAGE